MSNRSDSLTDGKQVQFVPWRGTFVLGCFALATVVLIGGVFYNQVINADHLADLAAKWMVSYKENTGIRGSIVDRNGTYLATSEASYDIFANPKKMGGDIRVISKEIAQVLDLDYVFIFDKIANDKSFSYLKRNVDKETLTKIQGLVKKYNLQEGLGFQHSRKRVYPGGKLAAHIIGFTDIDGNGLAGLEKLYNDKLAPKTMKEKMLKTAGGGRIHMNENVDYEALNGQTLRLTIDSRIQYKAEEALENAVFVNGAVGGSIVVMDVKTGEILAMANEPTFDPNDYGKASAADMRNRAVTDSFEPGSVFKTFAAVSYLKKHPKINVNDIFLEQTLPIRLENKLLKEHGKIIKDLTYTDMLVFSSNIGAATMALDVGDVELFNTLRLFGFGQKSGVQLLGEINGTLADPNKKKWARVRLANVSFGQGVAVTTLQLAAAYSAVANNGYYNPPTIMLGEHGEGHQAMSAAQAKTLQKMLGEVLTRGTGRRAQPDIYTAAGKTGTAQKAENGKYVEEAHMASFAGFAPMEDPRVAIVVNIDSPNAFKGGDHQGGQVSAPVFKVVMEESLKAMLVPPSPSREKESPKTKAAMNKIEIVSERDVPVELEVKEKMVNIKGKLPSLKGLSIAEALAVLNRKMPEDKAVSIVGTGFVSEQEPEAGTELKKVNSITLHCSPDARHHNVASELKK